MIDKEKQIENIAIDLNNIICFKENGLVARYATAEAMYNRGYRKEPDVVRKIFEEIEKKVKMSITIHLEELNKEHIIDTPLYDRHSGIVFALRRVEDYLAELKKKYESEGKKNNGNDNE